SYIPPSEVPEEHLKNIYEGIFGSPVAEFERTGRCALAKPLIGTKLSSYYFLPPNRQPGFHNEEHEYAKVRLMSKRQKK
nr:Chain By, mS33 [Polytomella magna]